MICHVFLRNGTVYVPTAVNVESAFYMDVDPVEVAPAANIEAVQRALVRVMNRGNAKAPMPSGPSFPEPVVLKYAKVKSWSEFEENCLNWSIEEENGVYSIMRGLKVAGRGWEYSSDHIEVLPPGTGIEETARRVAYLVHENVSRS
jgi:hypothetical protein